MKKKINRRLLLLTILAVVATALGITWIYYDIFRHQVMDDLEINARILADSNLFENEEEIPKDTQFENLSRDELRITWINTDGTVLFDNDTDVSTLENHMDRPEVKEAFRSGSGNSIRNSKTMNMNQFYYALKLTNGTVLRVAVEAKNMISVFLSSFPLVLGIMLLIVFICYWISRVLTRMLLEPIEDMAEHLDEMVEDPVYEELIPFSNKIKSQHENILAAVRSRQDFTANVSHELKTPLTAITGYAELIGMTLQTSSVNSMDSDEVTQQIVHFSEQICKNSDRLLALINDIIRLSELDHSEVPKKIEEIDLYDLVSEVVDSLEMNAYRKEVHLSFQGEHKTVLGVKDMIKELSTNLIQNAIQYNNSQGHVFVSIYHWESHTVLEVKDDGIGIPKDQQERVFERFYRVDKSRSRETGGTGLGLAIVKHIAQIHNAEISLQSDVGKGTRIMVMF